MKGKEEQDECFLRFPSLLVFLRFFVAMPRFWLLLLLILFFVVVLSMHISLSCLIEP